MSSALPNYPPGPFAHGLMLHHFYGGVHVRGQGAISAAEFDRLLDHIGPKRLLGAADWQERSRQGTLGADDLCVTFDDALRCQMDVALPVLEARGITAFWFVYSSVFQGVHERLELYRHVRTVYFEDIDSFYDAFDAALESSPHAAAVRQALAGFVPENYLAEAAFYTRRDRIFRYLRDRVLGERKYFEVMDALVERAGVARAAVAPLLWMNDADLKRLAERGHVIGLHSYSHPTAMASLPLERQRDEYVRNRGHLTSLLGTAPTTMSHPCNSYTAETLTVLRELGIDLGFRANMRSGSGSALERPRVDHADLMVALK